MAKVDLIRLGGLAGMLGGGIWVAALAIYSTQPLGEQGWREGTFPLNPFMVVAFLLIFAGVLGVHQLQRYSSGLFGKVALVVTCLGLGLLALGRVLVDLGVAPWYFAALPAMIFVLGLFLLGVSVALTRSLPRSVGILLAAAAFLMPVSNFETREIVLAMPLGFAWVLAGFLMWSRKAGSRSQTLPG
jgi:hypothetical protein